MSGVVILANGAVEFTSPDVYVLDLDEIRDLSVDADVHYAFVFALRQTDDLAAHVAIMEAAKPWAISTAEWAEANDLYDRLSSTERDQLR